MGLFEIHHAICVAELKRIDVKTLVRLKGATQIVTRVHGKKYRPVAVLIPWEEFKKMQHAVLVMSDALKELEP